MQVTNRDSSNKVKHVIGDGRSLLSSAISALKQQPVSSSIPPATVEIVLVNKKKKEQGRVTMLCELIPVVQPSGSGAPAITAAGVGTSPNSAGNSPNAISDSSSIRNFNLRIRKIQARNLINVERIGKNDPFVELKVGDNDLGKTPALKDTGSEGIWVYPDSDATQMKISGTKQFLETTSLSIKVFDENTMLSHGFIGEATVSLSSSVAAVGASGFGEYVLSLQLKDKGKDTGNVDITIGVAAELSTQQSKASANSGSSVVGLTANKDKPPFEEGELRINWINCRDLKNVETMRLMDDENDPYVNIRLGSWETRTEVINNGGSNPSWKDLYFKTDVTSDMIINESVKVQVYDHNISGAVLIGSADMALYKAMDPDNIGREVSLDVNLHDSKGKQVGTATFGVILKRHQAAVSKDAPIAEGFTDGLLLVTKINAYKLKNTELIGKQDPYVKLIYDTAPFQRTIHQDNAGASAVWNFLRLSFEVSARSLLSIPLRVEVWDYNVSGDTKIGTGDISVRSVASALDTDKELEVNLVASDGKSEAGLVVLTCKVIKKIAKVDTSLKVSIPDGLLGAVTITRITVSDAQNTEWIGKQVGISV